MKRIVTISPLLKKFGEVHQYFRYINLPPSGTSPPYLSALVKDLSTSTHPAIPSIPAVKNGRLHSHVSRLLLSFIVPLVSKNLTPGILLSACPGHVPLQQAYRVRHGGHWGGGGVVLQAGNHLQNIPGYTIGIGGNG